VQLLKHQFAETVGIKCRNHLYTSQGLLGLSPRSLSDAANYLGQ